MLRSADEIHTRFATLTRLLSDHRTLWETRPFVERHLSWEADHPKLAIWLRRLSHEQIDALEADASLLSTLSSPPALLNWHQASIASVQLEHFPRTAKPILDDRDLAHAIPARKWKQIQIFVETCSKLFPDSIHSLIDWCAGKGHVARMLQLATGLKTTALEKRLDLCRHGENLAKQRTQHDCHFACVDVIEESTDTYFKKTDGAVALHACGYLTDALFEQGIRHQTSALISVPCCYHNLGGEKQYIPRSQTAKDSGLKLSQPNLRLATAHETVARIPIRKARRREMAYRLGFDLLVREATGIDEYQQQGPFPKAILDLDFASFCTAASERLQLPLPKQFDAIRAEAAGAERARQARGLSLVRAVFRRPLELWLVLDRALRLSEQGRPVEIGLFCEANITPRNILIASCTR